MKKLLAVLLALGVAAGLLNGCSETHSIGWVPPHITTSLEQRTPLLIDSDGNIADFYALGYVHTCDKLDLRAITVTHGVVGLEQAGVNLLSAADLYEFSCPVALGERRPLDQYAVLQDGADGENGLGEVVLPTPAKDLDPRPAWQVMYEIAKEEGGRLQIVCMGPLTNVAKALDTYPDFAHLVAGITTTAGFGNYDQMPERDGWISASIMRGEPDLFNDQAAFTKVLGSGIPITSIGASGAEQYRLGYVPQKGKKNSLDSWLSPDSVYSDVFRLVRQQYKASGKYRDRATFPSVMALLSLIDDRLLTYQTLHIQQIAFDMGSVAVQRAYSGENAMGSVRRVTGFADYRGYDDAFFYMPRYYRKYK